MKERFSVFKVSVLVLTLSAVLFIGSNVFVIALEGSKSLAGSFGDAETLFALNLSLFCASISSVLCFLLAVPAAYTLTRGRSPVHAVIEVILELTMSLPYIVIGLSMLILFSSPVGKMLKEAGLPVVFNRNGIILAQMVVNLPFAIKLSSSAFSGVNRKLEHVAGLLGASEGRRFFTIILPLCKDHMISAFILVWSRALGEFGATLMLVGVTRMKTETLPGNIYLNVSTNDLGGALSSAFILLVISAVSLGLVNILTRKQKGRERYV